MGATFRHADYREVTIPKDGALSSVIELKGMRIAKIFMPAGWTPADLTLAESATPDGTFNPSYNDSGEEVKLPATTVMAASRVITIDEKILPFACGMFMQLRSGTAATPVNQAAARVIGLLLVG